MCSRKISTNGGERAARLHRAGYSHLNEKRFKNGARDLFISVIRPF
jgi:hypothetical protein